MAASHLLVLKAVRRSISVDTSPEMVNSAYDVAGGFWRLRNLVLVKSSAGSQFKRTTKKEDIETGEDMKAV